MKKAYMPRAAALVALLAALTLGGCGIMGGSKEPEPAYATVTVNNDSPTTVTAFAVRPNGVRYRLGTVPGLTEKHFDLRADMVGQTGEMQLVVDVLGTSRLYTSDQVFIDQGDSVEFTVSHMVR